MQGTQLLHSKAEPSLAYQASQLNKGIKITGVEEDKFFKADSANQTTGKGKAKVYESSNFNNGGLIKLLKS